MNLSVSLEAAAAELLRRRRARRSLIEWARVLGFEPAAHHVLICEEIEALLVSDEHDILVLEAPPGSAKSTYVSIVTPSGYIARHPKNSILAASHSISLAEKWGRRVRNVMADHGNVLGVKLAADSQAVQRWATDQGGEYMAAGVGVGIAGFRADLGIVDDPYGSKEDAYSERIREKVWDWFTHDFSSRLKPGAKRVVMHTRMHEDDLAGRIITEGNKGKFRVKRLSLPAVAGDNDPLGRQPGEYLWDDPSGYNYGAFLRARQKEAPAVEWASLYQQSPVIEGGNIFKRDEWKTFDPPRGVWPKADFVVAALDGAYTEKQENDFSALTVWRVYLGTFDAAPKIVLSAAWRKKLQLHGPDIPRLPGEDDDAYRKRSSKSWGLCEWVADTCSALRVDVLLIENKGSGLSITQEIKRLYSSKEFGVLTVDPKGRDKVARAWAIQHLWTDGLIYAPDREYAEMVKDEMSAFPRGKNDDLVDSAMYCVEWLRKQGYANRTFEHQRELDDLMKAPTKNEPVYEV